MIDRKALLADLRKLQSSLEKDLLQRTVDSDVPEVAEALRAEHQAARAAERTAATFTEWVAGQATQMAASWILSVVFVRFLEDNGFIDPPRVSGAGDRLVRARDEHEMYFRSHPTHSDRDYLLHVFDALAELPGGREVFGPHNGVRLQPRWLSGDAAGELLKFFQRVDAASGGLVHDFTDPKGETRFLGDLYQDLSEEARKKYALLQTPEFVEEFILERTLEPALDEFGLQPAPNTPFKMIDPACGSGHFLLGAFRRILDRWMLKEPGTSPRDLVARTLASVHGVDVNPFAVAIARFRLLIAAMAACGVSRLKDSPAFHVKVEAGDSLLHGVAGLDAGAGTGGLQLDLGFAEFGHYYKAEDPEELRRILVPGSFHAVVGNPPYITVGDGAQSQAYRNRYGSCHRKYSLSVPFMERIFSLAIRGGRGGGGYAGQITSNSFMKREFGKKLIEEFVPRWDLTHVIDTSGAYIPGHGTPTVILFGRNQDPVQGVVRAVLGIRGEAGPPGDPAIGLVWLAIVELVDQPGRQCAYVSSVDTSRNSFQEHPWSIGGGGAAELKELLQRTSSKTLGDRVEAIGFGSILGEDDCFGAPPHTQRIRTLPVRLRRPLVEGELVRDWSAGSQTTVLFPYTDRIELLHEGTISEWLWINRATLEGRLDFSKKTYKEMGRHFSEYHQIPVHRNRVLLSITFSFVSTHNHYVLDRGGKVFNRTAPVIKLPAGASEADLLPLLGLLNSSTACFWMKQSMQGKHKGDGGEAHADPAFQRYEYDGMKLKRFPIPADKPLTLPMELDRLAASLRMENMEAALNGWARQPGKRMGAALAEAERQSAMIRARMISLQEELDWQCYRLYGLTSAADDLEWPESALDQLPSISLGQRAFEIVLARAVEAGEEETTWFERHAHAGSRPITELPSDWPPEYRALVERRIAKIQGDKNIALIEKPEYKRRWNTEPWADRQEKALREWLLGRIESWFDFDGRMNDEKKPTARVQRAVVSVAKLAGFAKEDAAFLEAGAVLLGDPGFDVEALVRDLVTRESVPFLPVLRYKDTGLRKRAEWERTWELQRAEDAIDARTKLPKDHPQYLTPLAAKDLKATEIGDIPVPPKYTSADFLPGPTWGLRGKLDVPKERWVSFPHCEGADGTLPVAWAGYDHLQLARAVAEYYVYIQQEVGGQDDARLVPLLAGLMELLPWLKQWHNAIDPEFGMPMGDYFEGFVKEEARQMGRSLEDIRGWKPRKMGRGGGKALRGGKGWVRREGESGGDQEG